MLMLNFLKIQPEKSWYEFFVDRNSLKEFLNDPTTDRKALVKLCDQFIDQALLTYNEIKHAKRKRFDVEDIQRTERKREDLWRCSWACFASFGWDIESILQVSTVTKVYNMLCRLFEVWFQVNIKKDLISSLSEVVRSLNPSNVFIAWLCARLILIVDMKSRTPKPPVKQTVSNPNNQPDPALIEAAKVKNFTQHVRQCIAEAVQLSDKISSLNLLTLDIPTLGCFVVEKVHRFHTFDVKLHSKTVNFDILKVRTECDLLLCHFKAVHLKEAEKYFNKIQEADRINVLNNMPEEYSNTFFINLLELKAVETVLIKTKSQTRSSVEFQIQTHVEKRITFGETVRRLRERNVMVSGQLPAPSMPPKEILSRFISCGPVLWDLLHTLDYDQLLVLSSNFSEIYQREFQSPKNIPMSPILCELLERTPFNYNSSIYFFQQLEYVLLNVDILTWMSAMSTFTKAVGQAHHRLKDFLYNICFEVFRVRMSMWDILFGRPWNGLTLKLFTSGLNTMVTNSILNHDVVPTIEWGLGKIAAIYYPFLLNMNLTNVIMVVPTILRIPPPQAIFVRMISTVITNEGMSNVAWRLLHSVLLNDNVGRDPSTMSKNDFWDMTCKLRHEKVIKHVLTYLLAFYNKMVVRLERHRLPYADNRLRNSWAFMDKTIRDNKRRTVPDEYNVDSVDCTYLLGIIKRLLDNAIFSAPKDPYLRRQLGDVHYAVREYDKASLQYIEVLLLFQHKLTARHRRESLNDAMISKITHCFFQKKMYVLACLSGQLRRDLARHFIFLPQIASEVNKTHDAGAVYFKFLYDTKLLESLTECFEKRGYLYYLSQMLKLTPTKSGNKANMNQIKKHEIKKRKQQFLDVVIKTVKNTSQ